MNDEHINEFLRSTAHNLCRNDDAVIESARNFLETEFPETHKLRVALVLLKMISKGRQTVLESIMKTFAEEFPTKATG